MVRHIVMWSLEGDLTSQEKRAAAEKIKALLEPMHPDHLAAKEYIGSMAGNRACLDYEY